MDELRHNDVILWEQGRGTLSCIYGGSSLKTAGRSHARIPAGLEAELLYSVHVCVLQLCVP